MKYYFRLWVAIVLMVIIGFVAWNVAIAQYKNSCEIIGNSQGQKWRECDL